MSLLDEITRALELAQSGDRQRGQMWGGIASGLGDMFGGMVDQWQQGKKDRVADEALMQILNKKGTPDLTGQTSTLAQKILGPQDTEMKPMTPTVTPPQVDISMRRPSSPPSDTMAGLGGGDDALEIMKIALTKGLSPAKREEFMNMARGMQESEQKSAQFRQGLDFERWKTEAGNKTGIQKVRMQQRGQTKRERLQNQADMLEEKLKQEGLSNRKRAELEQSMARVQAQITAMAPERAARTAKYEAERAAIEGKGKAGDPERFDKLGNETAKTLTNPEAGLRPTENQLADVLAQAKTAEEAVRFITALRAKGVNEAMILRIMQKAKRIAGQ